MCARRTARGFPVAAICKADGCRSRGKPSGWDVYAVSDWRELLPAESRSLVTPWQDPPRGSFDEPRLLLLIGSLGAGQYVVSCRRRKFGMGGTAERGVCARLRPLDENRIAL